MILFFMNNWNPICFLYLDLFLKKFQSVKIYTESGNFSLQILDVQIYVFDGYQSLRMICKPGASGNDFVAHV